MAAIQRRKTSAAKRNLAGVLVPVVLVVAGSKLPPAGLLRYARFSWKIARLPAPSHYTRRACDSNYVNIARVEYATTRRITLGKACPTFRGTDLLIVRFRQTRFQAGRMENSRGQCKRIDRVANKTTRLGEIFPEKRLASSMHGRLIRQGKLTDTPRTVDGQLDSSPIRDANESDAGANERPGLRPAGRKTDWPTQMHTVIINLLEILRNRTDIHCAASSPEPAFPHTPSGVCAFFVPYFRVKEKSRDKLIAVTFISSRWLRSQQRKELCNCCKIL
ncbi:hypothetical protein G5I_01587 [Acromyrmex echinatior]|uniref:Uncharacterized protein n=1 Tax=Acromyrmex echinatior TaxID=103372 RepID=F4W810_ACREC|nr:hypothetical protein G5I_01587 [Acromyrmex echinatior]